MSPIQLYTFELCPYAHRVRLALAEKGLAAEMLEVDLKSKPASFLRISPTGAVPLLVHGNVKLWESAVISEYVDETFPDPPLLPATPAERALARIWIRFADERIYADTHNLIFTRDVAARRKLVQRMSESVRLLESDLLAKRPTAGAYAFGAQFTLLDLTLHPWFEQLGALEQFSEFRLPHGCLRLAEWRAAVSKRKAVQQCARTGDWYVQRYRTYLAA